MVSERYFSIALLSHSVWFLAVEFIFEINVTDQFEQHDSGCHLAHQMKSGHIQEEFD